MNRWVPPLVLGVLWSALFGFTVGAFAIGFVFGMGIAAFWRWFPRGTPAGVRLVRTGRFLVDFVVDLTLSNLRLFRDILAPRHFHRAALICVPVGDLTEGEIAFLSQRITLTPGTLACELSADRSTLLVHCMFPDGDMATGLRRPMDILKGNA